MVHAVVRCGGLEFDLRPFGLYCSVPFLDSAWLEIEAARGGKFFIVEKRPKDIEVWVGRLHIVADRRPR